MARTDNRNLSPMNTAPDQLDQEALMNLLKAAEPSWKTNRLPQDPAVEIFRKPAPERRALNSLDAPFGSVEANGSSGSSGGNSSSAPTVIIAAPVQSGGFYTSELVAVVGIVQ